MASPKRFTGRGREVAAAVLALLIATAGGVEGQAEDAESTEAEHRGFGYFSIGMYHSDLDGLNSALTTAGYPTFGARMLSLGGGGYGVNDAGLLLGGEGYAIIGGEVAGNGRAVSLGGGAGFFNIGWVFPVADRVRVYPVASLGGGGMTLGLGPAGSPASFDEVLEVPDREARVTRGGLLLGGGVGAELRLEEEGRGLMVGIRAGYVGDASSSAWRLGGSALAGGPAGGLEGFYVRLHLGGGG